MLNKGNLLGGAASYVADGAVTQYRAGQLTAVGVKQCDGVGQRVDGVIGWDAPSGQQVTIFYDGAHTAVSGAAIAAGAEVMTGADGRFVTHVPAAGNEVAGVAESPTTAAGQTFIVNHFKGGPTR